MATKQFYATGTFKFANRMLTAGDPVQMDGPTGRLYLHLGKISETKPRAAATIPPAPAEGDTATITKPKAAPRKRVTRRKK